MANIKFSILAIALACFFMGTFAFDGEVEEEVLVLTEANFEGALAEFEFILVEFYAPWCGHCKHLAPEYAAAAQELASKGSNVKLGKVDATVEAKLGEQFQIRGFPTLKFFIKGKPIEYTGGRTKDTILSWVNKYTMTTVPQLASRDALKVFTESSNAVVLFTTSTDQSTFVDAARNAPAGFEFAAVTDPELIKEEVGTPEQVRIYVPFAKKPIVAPATEDIPTFIKNHGYDVVVEFQREDYSRLSEKADWIVLAVVDYTNTEEKASVEALLRKLAPEFPKLGLTYADSSVYGRAVSQVGGTGNKFPTLIAVTGASATNPKQLAWDEEQDVSEATAREWFSGLLDGTARIFKKSEPVPEDNNGPVRVLVGKTFEEEVLKSGKNVFVEFYAPWCGHCKSLAPIWEELGAEFKGTDVVIANIDATANYVDSAYGVTGFPTLILFKQDGSYEKYNGPRELADFKSFLAQFTGASATAADPHAGHSHSHDEL